MYYLLRRLRSFSGCLALAMAVIIIILSVASVCGENFLQQFKKNVSCQNFLSDDDDGLDDNEDYKPPKHSFTDYSCLFCAIVLPLCLPLVSMLRFREPYRQMPEVYYDVLAPPHPVASITVETEATTLLTSALPAISQIRRMDAPQLQCF